MKWKPISELPNELLNEDILLRIEPRNGRGIIFVMGCVDEEENIYTDEQYASNIGGFLSRDFYKEVWYVNQKEIELTE